MVGLGSGVAIGKLRKNGLAYMITAAHNVKNARTVTIRYGENSYAAEVVAADYKLDLAVLSLDTRYNWSATEVAKSLPPMGVQVKSLGYPLGQPQLRSRMHHLKNVSDRYIDCYGGWARGNSGGALAYKEELVGVIVSVVIRTRPGHLLKCPSTEEYIHGNGRAVSITTVRKFLIDKLGGVPSLNPKQATKPEEPTPPKKPEVKPEPPTKPEPAVPVPPTKSGKPSKIEFLYGLLNESGVAWGLGPIAGAALTYGIPYFWRRRKRRKAKKEVETPVPAEPFHVEVPAQKDRPRMPPRDTRELHSVVQLGQLEGRDPILDSFIGIASSDEIETTLADPETTPEIREYCSSLRQRIRDRVNQVAPISIKGQ